MEDDEVLTNESIANENVPVNKLARVAWWLSLGAWAFFVIAAITPVAVSQVFGSGSVLLALAGFVMGLVSLKNRPRMLSVASLVFSGVIILITIIVLVGFSLLSSL